MAIHFIVVFCLFMANLITFIIKLKLTNDNHFFINRTFFYKHTTINKQNLSNVAIILATTEAHINPQNFQPECVHDLPKQKKWRQKAALERIYHDRLPLACRLAYFRIICHSMQIWDGRMPRLTLSFSRSIPIRLAMSSTDSTNPKGLIACPGRMFAMELWHVLITALETHRIYGVKLVVVHILSVRNPLFELVQLYELDGLIKLRPSLRMPASINTLPYDPNTEGLFSNQIADSLECLYEFRESADFISFPDWDDLLVAGNVMFQFTPLASILTNLTENRSDIAFIKPARILGNFPPADQFLGQNMSLYQFWTEGNSSYSEQQRLGASKVIVRPLLVTSIDLHTPYKMGFENYNVTEVSANDLYFIHARDWKPGARAWKRGNLTDLPGTFDLFLSEGLNASFTAFLLRHKPLAEEIFHALPRSQVLHAPIQKCHENVEQIAAANSKSHCFNFRQCWNNSQTITEEFNETSEKEGGNYCANVHTNWIYFSRSSQSLRVFVHQNNNNKSFEYRRGKCFI